LKKAYELHKTTTLSDASLLRSFKPLASGHYPVVNKYPKFVVDYEMKERERMRMEEEELLRSRKNLIDLQSQSEKFEKQNELWIRKQQTAMESEYNQRKEALNREQELLLEKMRVKELTREEKLRELELIEKRNHQWFEQQQLLRDQELHRLQEEMQAKSARETLELRNLIEDLKIQKLEQQTHNRMREVTAKKELNRQLRQLRQESEYYQKQRELEAKVKQENWRQEDEQKQIQQKV
jgi:hypothetical protein